MSYLIPPCVVSRSFRGVTRAVCLGCRHDHRVQLLSALSGRFLWHGPGNTLCLGPTQGHMWCKRSHTHTNAQTQTQPSVLYFLYHSRSVRQCCGAQSIQSEHRYVWWRQDIWPPTFVTCPTWTRLVGLGHMGLVLELVQGLWLLWLFLFLNISWKNQSWRYVFLVK